MTENNITGAEALIKCLIQEETDTVFGYPGGAIMPVYDLLYNYQKEVHHVLTRHEQGAIHMAQGYARATGKMGVAIATSGPGATNLVTGIADANMDSTPVICITGQVASSLLGTDAFQEVDIISMTNTITKWNYQITSASEIPEVMAKAFYIAKAGRPGPVLIDITKDAQTEEMSFHYTKEKPKIKGYFPVPKTDQDQIKSAANTINNAKKPLIVFGQGVILAGAEQELKALVEKTGIPSAWTILGSSALPTNHKLNIGMVGMHGNYAPNMLTNEADVLIGIGMRFDDRVTGNLNNYATQAKIVHFDIDKAEINKNVTADFPVLGDCKETLASILPLLNENNHSEWIKEFKRLDEIEKEKVITPELTPRKEKKKLTMAEVIHNINQVAKGEVICVTDVGQHQMVTCRYIQTNSTRSNITSGGLGTMGFCLPAAIGAKIGAPEKEVVAIMGDAGFQMCLQELGTVFQTKTAVKIVILNNQYLGMVRQWQELFYDERYSQTYMHNPNFIKIAEGYDIKTKRVKERKELAQAIKEMMASKESYLLEVVVEKKGNVFPMVPSGASVSDVRLS